MLHNLEFFCQKSGAIIHGPSVPFGGLKPPQQVSAAQPTTLATRGLSPSQAPIELTRTPNAEPAQLQLESKT